MPARGSCPPRGLAQPATATATLAIPLDGLTLTAPQPELLSQKNVESVTGIPARVFLDTLRGLGFPLPVMKLGKLRLVQREAFVAYLQALASNSAPPRAAAENERTGVVAVLAAVGLEPVRQPRAARVSAVSEGPRRGWPSPK
ncbi:hypothetical protein WMF27_30200 [Sorangium sp. So ce281]|uniref:hypothetical protein n=1 Tax=unclassified Sorangium TaxID=2621164 RepID=UPI003F644A14